MARDEFKDRVIIFKDFLEGNLPSVSERPLRPQGRGQYKAPITYW
jgi:hypothetical protein